jgi:DNA-binding transcriptional MerR regulator
MVEQKKLTISEVAEITGYKPHVIRYYEKEFNLEIPRNKSGHRYFTYKEIETLQYIKQLQEKGLTNNQIKLILRSPEIMVDGDGQGREIAVAQAPVVAGEFAPQKLQEYLLSLRDEIKGDLKDLTLSVKELSDEIRAKERDVLICENAKLKMDLKRKAYEVAELREQLKREKSKNKPFLSKLFGK